VSLWSLTTGEDDFSVVDLDFDLSGGTLVGWLDEVCIVAGSVVALWLKWSGTGMRIWHALGWCFPLVVLR